MVEAPSIEMLTRYAHGLTGQPVAWHRGGPKGAWLPDPGIISIRLGMTDAQTRSTLAHELAHAEAGDPCGVIPLAERAADRRAAQMLIHAEQWASIEVIYGPDVGRIADELCVTEHLARTWRGSRLHDQSEALGIMDRQIIADQKSPSTRRQQATG